MNVLIVEDEKSLATEIALFLKRENFLCDIQAGMPQRRLQ
jgi:DNA-binding response OmpR family regulator